MGLKGVQIRNSPAAASLATGSRRIGMHINAINLETVKQQQLQHSLGSLAQVAWNAPDSPLPPSSAISLCSLRGHDVDIMVSLVDCWLAGI